MAEVHVIGQIVGASGFPDDSLFCKWELRFGSAWHVVAGDKAGQTQVDKPRTGEITYWSHPLDIHLATKGVQGWPKLHLQVWHFDSFGRSELYGYGVCHIPTSPGTHALDCVTWQPLGTFQERFRQHFVGGSPHLAQPSLVLDGVERHRLHTISMGKIHLKLGIITRHFDRYGVEF